MTNPDQLAELLTRLVRAVRSSNKKLVPICENCNADLLLLCPDCEHYDEQPDASEHAHTGCSSCERTWGHESDCGLGNLLFEAAQTIRDLEDEAIR